MDRAQIIVEYSQEKFFVSFNPEEYTLNKDNNFASQAIPGLSSPLLQFVNGNLRTLEMELFFDTYSTPSAQKQDVRDLTGKVMKLMDIDPKLHAPPVLHFVWGSLDFRCVLTRASQKFIMFADDGRPVRARITVTFSECVDTLRESKQVKRETADFVKRHIVIQGETVSGIAAALYGDPGTWRPIALASGLEDPSALVPGLELVVPSLPYTDPESGEVVN
jgi:Contractile injection system tube protein